MSLEKPLISSSSKEDELPVPERRSTLKITLCVMSLVLVFLAVTSVLLNLPCLLWQLDGGKTYTDFSTYSFESPSDCFGIYLHQTYTFPKSKSNSLRIVFDSGKTDLDGLPITLTSYDSDDLTTPLTTFEITSVDLYASSFDLNGTVLEVKINTKLSETLPGYQFDVLQAVCDDFISQPTLFVFDTLDEQVFASPRNYCNNLNVTTQLNFTHPSVRTVFLHFSSDTGPGDSIQIKYLDEGGDWENYSIPSDTHYFTVPSNEIEIILISDEQYTGYGYYATFDPTPCAEFKRASEEAFYSNYIVYYLESPHQYCNGLDVSRSYMFHDDHYGLQLIFDENTSLEDGKDFVTITDNHEKEYKFTGSNLPSLLVSSYFTITLTTDGSGIDYGYKVKIIATECTNYLKDQGETYSDLSSQVIESDHDYCRYMNATKHYSWTDPAVTSVFLDFNHHSKIEDGSLLTITYTNTDGQTVSKSLTGSHFDSIVIEASEFDLDFTTGDDDPAYGYKISMYPGPAGFTQAPPQGLRVNRPSIVESSHPYASNLNYTANYSSDQQQTDFIRITFDTDGNSLEENEDFLIFSYTDTNDQTVEKRFTGSSFEDFQIDSYEFDLSFTSNDSVNDHGYRFTAESVGCSDYLDNPGATYDTLQTQIIESPHPPCRFMNTTQLYSWTDPTVTSIYIQPAADCDLGRGQSLVLRYNDHDDREVTVDLDLDSWYTPFDPFVLETSEFHLDYITYDNPLSYGYKLSISPGPAGFTHDVDNILDTSRWHNIESSHPYANNLNTTFHFNTSGESPDLIQIRFNTTVSSLESDKDFLIFRSTELNGNQLVKNFTGDTFEDFEIHSDSFDMEFISNESVQEFGYRFEVLIDSCTQMKDNPGATWATLETQVIESSHPICADIEIYQEYEFTNPDVNAIAISFDDRTDVARYPLLVLTGSSDFFDSDRGTIEDFVIRGSSFRLTCINEWVYNTYGWGYKFSVEPLVNYSSAKGTTEMETELRRKIVSSQLFNRLRREDTIKQES